MTVLLRPPLKDDLGAEALIKEARRLRRRRWAIGLSAVLVITGGSALGYAISASTGVHPAATHTNAPGRPSAVPVGGLVSPEHPYGLATSANGDLYVVDSGRDQILRRLASGKFQVVAGNGKRGFSGDGGPAIDAEIHLEYSSGIAIARNGTVYFSDTWNGRVREVLSDGIIKTVVGGGWRSIGLSPLPARDVSFSKSFTVTGLVIAPNDELYIAANAVYRLSPNGMLHWVVGKSITPKHWPKGWGGVYSNPAIQNDFTSAERLAFDSRGDLLVAGGGGWGLYEMTATGKLRYLETFRGDGFWGSLAEAPDGSVVLSDRGGLSRFTSSGAIIPILAQPVGNNTSALDRALGRMNGGSHENTFLGGDGVIVGSNGVIYADVDTGSSFTSVNAILAVSPYGQVKAIWRS